MCYWKPHTQVLNVQGEDLEALRFWQYVVKNGKDSLYKAYSVSLDLYVLFCWGQLGGLSGLLTGLLVTEVRRVCCTSGLWASGLWGWSELHRMLPGRVPLSQP
jgi:hypothetical protein